MCNKSQGYYHTHTLYETGDPDAPTIIQDRNGEVALGLCKLCGAAEAGLKNLCVPKPLPHSEQDA